MTGLIEIGQLKAATDQTMAYEINRASQSRAAVDSRVQGVAAGIIAGNPTIIDAAEAAVDGAAEDAALLSGKELSATRALDVNDATYSEVVLSRDFRRIGGRLRSGGGRVGDTPNVIEASLPTGDETVKLSRDYRRIITETPFTGLFTTLTGWGDSMTTDHGSVGVSQTLKLAEYLGVDGYDRGVSGDTGTQIAWRMGALDWRITVDGGEIPATGAVACTITPANGHNQSRSWPVTLMGEDGTTVQATLTHGTTTPGATPTWTITQSAGGSAVTVLPDTRVKYVGAPTPEAFTAPATFWIGRNDADETRVIEALSAMLSQHRDPKRRRLVRPIFNRSTEPSGSGGYDNIMTINAAIAELAGADYFDDRAALIEHGLDIAGITPTSGDLDAIAADQIPPSLMLDGLHLNEAGRLALARIDAIEISGRNW